MRHIPSITLGAITRIGLVTALLAAAMPGAAGEVYYRWVNERGHAVHSDRPPPEGVDYEVVSTGSTLRREVDAQEGAVPAEIKPKPGNEFEPVEQEPAKPEKNPEYCAIAQDNLQQLDSRARIRRQNEQGDTYFLSDEERQEERQKAQDAIEAYCD